MKNFSRHYNRFACGIWSSNFYKTYLTEHHYFHFYGFMLGSEIFFCFPSKLLQKARFKKSKTKYKKKTQKSLQITVRVMQKNGEEYVKYEKKKIPNFRINSFGKTEKKYIKSEK